MSKAASFSRVQTYKNCPASYEWQYILGNKNESGPGPAALRGTRIHNSIEQAFLTNDVHKLDEEIPAKLIPVLMEHHGRDDCECRPEMPFAFTRDWEPTEFDAKDAYVRGLMDNVFIYADRLIIHEYKTGKERDEHADQKQLYAMAGMLLWPDISNVKVVGIYIDAQKIVPTTYNRAHLPSMQYTWQREIDKLHLPMYPARPGMHCRWCPKSSKHADGPCPLG